MEVGTQGSRLALPWVLAGCRRKLWGISLEADMITRGKATQIGHVRSMHAPARMRAHTHTASPTRTPLCAHAYLPSHTHYPGICLLKE